MIPCTRTLFCIVNDPQRVDVLDLHILTLVVKGFTIDHETEVIFFNDNPSLSKGMYVRTEFEDYSEEFDDT